MLFRPLMRPLPSPRKYTGAIALAVLLTWAVSAGGEPEPKTAETENAEAVPTTPAQKLDGLIASAEGISKSPTPSMKLARERVQRYFELMKQAHAEYATARDQYQTAWKQQGAKDVCAADGIAYTAHECRRSGQQGSTAPTSLQAGESSCIRPPAALVQQCRALLDTEPRMAHMTFLFLEQVRYKNNDFRDFTEYSREAILLSRLGTSELWEQLQGAVAGGVNDEDLPHFISLMNSAAQKDSTLWIPLAAFLSSLEKKGVTGPELEAMLTLMQDFGDERVRKVLKARIKDLADDNGATPEQTKKLEGAVDGKDPAAFIAAMTDLAHFSRGLLLGWVKDINPKRRYLQQQRSAGTLQVAYREPTAGQKAESSLVKDFVNHLVALLATTTTEGVAIPKPIPSVDWATSTKQPLKLCNGCDSVLTIESKRVTIDGEPRLELSGRLDFRQSHRTAGGKASAMEPITVSIPFGEANGEGQCLGLSNASDAASAAGRFMQQLRSQVSVAVGDLSFVRQLETDVAVMEPLHCGVTVKAQLHGDLDVLRKQLSWNEGIGVVNNPDAPCGSEWISGIETGLKLRGLQAGSDKAGATLSLHAAGQNCTGEFSLGSRGSNDSVYTLNAESTADTQTQGGIGMAHYVAAVYPPRFSVVVDEPREANWMYAGFALLLPGLPWLVDDVDSWDAFGAGLSATDVALWFGTALAYSSSVSLRNDFADHPDEPELLTQSENRRDLGNGGLIALGVLRGLAALGYLIFTPEPGRTSAATESAQRGVLTWSF